MHQIPAPRVNLKTSAYFPEVMEADDPRIDVVEMQHEYWELQAFVVGNPHLPPVVVQTLGNRWKQLEAMLADRGYTTV